MKAVLKYPGAKNRLATWIVGFIPDHKVYLEPYFGSGAVLFNKPRSHIETINDLNSDVTNYFEVLRDTPEALIQRLACTPYARQEYDNAYLIDSNQSKLEQARMFCVRCWQGFGCANVYHNGFKSGQQKNSPNPARAWAKLPEVLQEATVRLQGVQIENLDACEIIERYNTADVFMYVDPPYLISTRKNHLYKHEMNDEQHINLLKALLHHPGKVLLSGYDNELYDRLLIDWHKESIQTQAEHGLNRTETLWMNYMPTQQLSLFDHKAKDISHET